jgi:hypothetical protein
LAILQFSWKLSNHPLVDFKLKNVCYSVTIFKIGVCHFVNFPLLFIQKYRYDENRVANPNFKKITLPLDICLKIAQNVLQKNPQIAFLGENSPKLAILV